VSNVQPITPEQAQRVLVAAVSKLIQPTYGTGQSASSRINGLFRSYAPLGYKLPWETLDYIELLARYNPDYSQAVDNIRTLANSGHELFVSAAGKRRQQRIKEALEEKARTIQEGHGGIDGVIDKLLMQGATYGAMAGEWILNEDLSDVVGFADVNPKHIRFFWGETTQSWEPYQKVSGSQAQEAKNAGIKVVDNCVQLNPLTFRYYAFDAEPGSPYGTPPFLAALGPIAIQRDMVENLAQVVKKLGLLAMIDMKVKALNPMPNESESDFRSRAEAYLTEYVNVAQEMAKDGGLVHFDDVELDVTQLTGNAAGATNIFKQNEEQVFSGLKSMPSVQGRSYSTTETYAGVAYDIIIRNTAKYQRAVKRMIEAGYWLMATLWREEANTITLKFKENKTLMRLQTSQAERLEIQNVYRKWRMGILDQDGAAAELGYSEVKKAYPEAPPIYNDRDASGEEGDSTQTPENDENRGDETHNRSKGGGRAQVNEDEEGEEA
jgi:hypothetical protein